MVSIDGACGLERKRLTDSDTGEIKEAWAITVEEDADEVDIEFSTWLILGGLTESKTSNTRSGFSFLPWSLSKQDDDQTVDVLVILQLEKV